MGNGKTLALDAKLGLHGVKSEKLPPGLQKTFPDLNTLVIVSAGGKKMHLNKHCLQCPIHELTDYLLSEAT